MSPLRDTSEKFKLLSVLFSKWPDWITDWRLCKVCRCQEVKVYQPKISSKHLAHSSVLAPLLARRQHIQYTAHTLNLRRGPSTVNPSVGTWLCVFCYVITLKSHQTKKSYSNASHRGKWEISIIGGITSSSNMCHWRVNNGWVCDVG